MKPLQALIISIPYVGESIEALIVDPATKTAERRLQFMLVELHREMRVMDESRIRTDFLQTEEWARLVRQAVARSIQTRDCKRLNAIARVLAQAATETPVLDGMGIAAGAPREALLQLP